MAFKRSAVRSRLSPPKQKVIPNGMAFVLSWDKRARKTPWFDGSYSCGAQAPLFCASAQKTGKIRTARRRHRSRSIPLISTKQKTSFRMSQRVEKASQVCRLSAFGGQIVRAAGRGLLSKNSKGVFRQPQTSFRMSFFATVPPRPTAAAAAAASRRRFSS